LILFHGIGCHSYHDNCNTHMSMRKKSPAKRKAVRRRKRR
jgi:hypothetical protein